MHKFITLSFVLFFFNFHLLINRTSASTLENTLLKTRIITAAGTDQARDRFCLFFEISHMG